MRKMILGAVGAAMMLSAVPVAAQSLPLVGGDYWDVTAVKIVEANPSRWFDRSVINALSQWKFQADGEKYIGEIEVEFKLE